MNNVFFKSERDAIHGGISALGQEGSESIIMSTILGVFEGAILVWSGWEIRSIGLSFNMRDREVQSFKLLIAHLEDGIT
ncbi:MAG: hypothetical protein OEL84_06660 [Nitrosopumilus sp.]|nr:hypothetical protein [Nitrosopumilus sp.]